MSILVAYFTKKAINIVDFLRQLYASLSHPPKKTKYGVMILILNSEMIEITS